MKNCFVFLFSILILYFLFISNWTVFLRDGQIVDLSLRKSFFTKSMKTIKVKVVKDEKNLKQGLSNRFEISDGEVENIDAMLFIFDSPMNLNFWMKDMNFNIDICWLKDKKIVSCERDLLAEEKDDFGELKIFQSTELVRMVLETEPYFIKQTEFLKLFPQKSIFFLF